MPLEPVLFLSAAALATGLGSARLPAGGHWTGSSAFFLAALWMPSIPLGGKILVALIGLSVSAVRASHPRGLVVEGLALLAAGLASGGAGLPGWASGLVYLLTLLGLQQMVASQLRGHARMAWNLSRRESALGALSNLAAAAVVALAMSPLPVLAAVVLLMGLGRGARNYAYRLQSGAARQTLSDLTAAEQGLAEATRTGAQLRHQVEALAWLAESLQELAASLRVEEVLMMLQAQSQRLCQQHATVITWDGQSRSWGQAPAELSQLLGQAIEQSRPFVTGDVLCLPLGAGQSIRGAIGLLKEGSGWNEMQVQSMLALCRGVSVSLSNALLFAQVEASQKQLLETQAQLVQSGKLTAVGQLAAGVAHELNSPLAAIQATLEMTLLGLEKSDTATLKRRLERAHQATLRTRDIVNKLLDHSRPSLPEERLELPQLVAESLDFLDPQVSGSGVELRQGPVPALAVSGRSGELQQVLTNLILNARDACLEAGVGQPAVEVSCERQGEQVVIWVCDNGTGIAPEIAPRLFEPFFTTKGPGRGTGLGLWTSLEIARAHRGGLEFDSRPGQGTRFGLRLPVLESQR